MFVRNSLGLMIIALAIAGCAGKPTVTENQCAAGDWYSIGYRDGQNGLHSSQLLKHQDACVEHGFYPDRPTYIAGWNEGVTLFCDPNNAFHLGETGRGHNNVCQGDARQPFLRAYSDGRSLFLARRAVIDLERALAQNDARLEAVRQRIVSTATSQLDPDLTAADRIELVAETHRLTEERHQLALDRPAIERDLVEAQIALDHLQQSLAHVAL